MFRQLSIDLRIYVVSIAGGVLKKSWRRRAMLALACIANALLNALTGTRPGPKTARGVREYVLYAPFSAWGRMGAVRRVRFTLLACFAFIAFIHAPGVLLPSLPRYARARRETSSRRAAASGRHRFDPNAMAGQCGPL